MARCEEEELVKSPRVHSRNQSLSPSPAETPEPLPESAVSASKLIALDTRFSKWVHEHCLTDFTYSFLRFFEYSGDGLFWLPATAIFWFSPSACRPETRHFALNLFLSLLLDLLVVGTIKSVVRRERPQHNRGHLLIVSLDHWSFPSGHSTRAAMVLTLLWLYTPLWHTMMNQHWYPTLRSNSTTDFMRDWTLPHVENHALPIGKCACVLWMVATAVSRVVLGRHYALDVVGGVVIGVAEALVAHWALHVPMHVSELQHAYLLSFVGVYEEALGRWWHGGRGGVGSLEFGEMQRLVVEADLGAL